MPQKRLVRLAKLGPLRGRKLQWGPSAAAKGTERRG